MIQSKSILRATASLAASIVLFGGTSNAENEGLVAYYTFDNGVIDITGNIKPIDTQVDAPTAAGKAGKALRFDGETVVEIPINLSTEKYPEFTVSMWVKMDPPPTDDAALKAMLNYGVVASQVLGINARKQESASFYAEVPGAKVSNRDHKARAGQWAHVVVTRKVEDRANSRGVMEPHVVTTLYSDGEKTEKAGRLGKNIHQSSIYLGGANNTGGRTNFIGLIDDLQIYDRVLDQEEVAVLKTSIGQQAFPGDNFDESDTSERADKKDLKNPIGSSTPVLGAKEALAGSRQSEGSSDDKDAENIGYESPIRDNPFDSNKSPVEPLEEGASRSEPTLSLPKDVLKDAVGKLPTGDVSADQNVGTPPIISDGITGGPSSIDTGTTQTGTDQPLNTGSLGGDKTSGPLPGQAPATPGVQLFDDVDAISQATAAADWAVTDLKLFSEAEEQNLVSGKRVKLKASVRRSDRANKLSKAYLTVVMVPANGGSRGFKKVSLVQPGDGVIKDYPIMLDVPVLDQQGKPLTAINVIATATIGFDDPENGIDETSDNNRRHVSYMINKVSEEKGTAEGCDESSTENEDGTRTAKGCLVTTAKGNASINFENDLMYFTDIPFSSRYTNGTLQDLLLNRPLKSLQWSEANDKPCYLQIYGDGTRQIDICRDGPVYDTVLMQSPGLHEVITGIRICRNVTNRRVKGVSFQYKTIDKDGNLSQPRADHYEKTNCVERTNWDYCPGNTIARGLRVRIADGVLSSPQKFIHSVDLICGTPIIQKK